MEVNKIGIFFTLKLLAFIFLFLGNSFLGYSDSIFQENENDKLALLSFKSHVAKDPLGVLNTWNDSSHFCYWLGVQCDSKSHRVIALNLTRQELVGTLSPHVGNLSFLETLDLSSNLFNDEIPLGLGNLQRLSTLNMSSNSLRGKIPRDLSNCSQLRNLSFYQNNLIGNVPHELGLLSELLLLNLGVNNLYGNVPTSLGNLTSLRMLDLAYNSFYGEVPTTISQLKDLKSLVLSSNNLSGEFPPFLYNLSSLEMISLAINKFTGSLRNDIGFALPNLKTLFLDYNSFVGYISESLPNATKLESIDFSENNFIGRVPSNVGSLKYLTYFSVGNNSLGRGEPDDLDFITSLTNCSNLQNLQLQLNMFGGLLPLSITNLSAKLTFLSLHGNSIHGNIPRQISNLQSLTVLLMFSNYLSGTIPESIGMLQYLTDLVLYNNQLTGKIPEMFGNLTQMMWLSLGNNKLEGEIPQSLANCDRLVNFQLDQNNLNGTIPRNLMSLSYVLWFTLSRNSLTGHVPENLGNLSSLVTLDLSNNKLYGKIPSSIGNCLDLNVIFFRGNQFDGNIPESLAMLKGLSSLDLSSNNVSGSIPTFLSNLSSLVYLNLSFNNLDGEVPSTGVFSNNSVTDVRGNPSLCGGIPEFHLPTCYKERPRKSDTKKRLKSLLLILIIVLPTSFVALSLLLIMIYLILVYIARKKFKQLPRSSSSSSRPFNFYPKISYQDLARATGGFSSESLIGSGSFGTVYRGALTSVREDVAVKVLNLERKGASKTFLAECEALKNIRHYNLVKVITACSSIDFQGNEFKAIVFQFMSNGNLNNWLHPEQDEDGESGSKGLNILQRIGIALDVASAIEYLHHQCETPIIHCDLKPHNILLDDDMAAHVGDFGLARLIPNLKMIEDGNQFSSLGIKGTIGYAAPEYGMGAPVSIMGDVYSFGIVLLEIITGKRPTDSFLQEKNLKLQEFVELALREQDIDVFDNASLREEVTREAGTWSEGSNSNYLTYEQIECLKRILQIGVTCSSESPKNRMTMSRVYQELSIIRDAFCPKELTKDLRPKLQA